MDRDFFKGKSVLVMGLGKFGGGLDSTIFAHNAGAKVIVTDLEEEKKLCEALGELGDYDNIEYHLGGHRKEDFGEDGADIIIVNPAVAADNSFLEIARGSGRIITSQIELFFELCPCRIIGITGANGKSTTTALVAHLLRSGIGQKGLKNWSGENVFLGGNIGNKPLLGRLNEIEANDLVVLELSSFQLEQLGRLRRAPFVSVITNLTPNHLDRHGTFEAYCGAKENIFRFQELDENTPAVSVFNAEDALTKQWFERYRNQKGRVCKVFRSGDVPKAAAEKFALAGAMNLSNLAAAVTVAGYFGVSDERMAEAAASFRPLPHRLELVTQIDGVSWYDDSIATTPQSAIAALDSFDAAEIIIAGGYDKKLPFDELGAKIAEKAKAAILIGQTAPAIAKAIHSAGGGKESVNVEIAGSLADAVARARALAEPGDVVLLSPGCASYDMFDNYQQRGELFRELAKVER